MLDIYLYINDVFLLLPFFFWIVYTLFGTFLSHLEPPRCVGIINIIAVIHINYELSCSVFHLVHDILCKQTTALELIHHVLLKDPFNHSNWYNKLSPSRNVF